MTVQSLFEKASRARNSIQQLPEAQLKKMLRQLSAAIVDNIPVLLKANAKDMTLQDPGNPKNDRLLLTESRLKNIAGSIINVAGLPNPVGVTLVDKTLPNGLKLKKKSVPLGVVGAIYESRPNVTFDIAALCLRSHNVCVLKGSSDAAHTNEAVVKLIKGILLKFNVDTAAVTLLPPRREVIHEMFTATKYLDVLIPRGSDTLIQLVRQNSRVPVIETGAGVCHVYVHAEADVQQAVDIVVNAKVSRPSVCNAMDTVLLDAAITPEFLEKVSTEMEKYGVTIYADKQAYPLLKKYPYLKKAVKADYGREFLSLQCAVKVVRDIDEALEHIAAYSTKHSEAIVSRNKTACRRFLNEVDAAAVYSNASTRFTDGEEFGLGAEIGISTQKLHARGPFALEKLVTEKWVIEGNGQVR